MADFNLRSDAVNVEQIMEQIRARIREKRGVDYTEQQIQEMAGVKLEKFLDPRGVRSDLLEQFRRSRPPYAPPELPNYAFEEQTLFESHRAPLRFIRRLLAPILKLFFNPNPLIQALNIQSRLNTMYAEREARNEAARHTFDSLHYEVIHNLVVEMTRMGIEVKNLKMQVESLTSRLEFNERRARALESAVVYKPSAEDSAERPGRDGREQRDNRDGREPRAARDGREARPPRDSRESRDPRESREPREARELRETREPRESRESREPREAVEARPEDTSAPAPAPDAAAAAAAASATPSEGPGQRSRRRRRRRGRRGSGSAAALMGPEAVAGETSAEPSGLSIEAVESDVLGPSDSEPRDDNGADAAEPSDHEQ